MSMASVFICRCHDKDRQGVSVPNGLSEWQLAPAIDSAIRDAVWLENHHPYMLGSGTLKSRVKAVNAMCEDKLSKPPHCTIEVHCNWSSDSRRQGFFVMAHKQSSERTYLAHRIVDEMAHVLGNYKNLGVNKVDSDEQWIGTKYQYKTERQYFVCKTMCPAVLVECCFLSNHDEAEWIAQSENRSRLGKSIGIGINEYLKGAENG